MTRDDNPNDNEEYDVVDTYVGEETTIYYDSDGEQHVKLNGED